MSDVGLQFKGLFVLCYVKFTIVKANCEFKGEKQEDQKNKV